MRVDKFTNGIAVVKDGIKGEVIKDLGDRVVDWIWKLCNMALESGVWKCAVIVSLFKGKGERTECKSYRGISVLSVVGKIYAGILIYS